MYEYVIFIYILIMSGFALLLRLKRVRNSQQVRSGGKVIDGEKNRRERKTERAQIIH